MQEKEIVCLQKISVDGDFRYGLFLNGFIVNTFRSNQRFRAVCAARNLLFAVNRGHISYDSINIKVYE